MANGNDRKKAKSRKVRVLEKGRSASRGRKTKSGSKALTRVHRGTIAAAANGAGPGKAETSLTTATNIGAPDYLMPQGSLEDLRMQNARNHDSRFRELEKQAVATWSEMAELATVIRDNREWELLGFSSWNKWLEDAAPQSRASMYAGIGLLESLQEDVPKEELRQIPLSTAKVMKHLPKRMRRDPGVVEDAKRMPPKKFVKRIQKTAPELHIEKLAPRKYGFSESQAVIIDGACDAYREIEEKPDATDEECLEAFAADWMIGHKDAWDALKAMKAAGGMQ